VLAFLEPVRERDGLVLELGCGSGLLTQALVEAGHHVIATDASMAMLEIARNRLGAGVEEIRRLTLPDDPLPQADAIVAIGHPISYLPDAPAIDRALVAISGALLPGGRLALDICDFEWGEIRDNAPNQGRSGSDWAIITEFSVPARDRFVRDITTFILNDDGSWRRETEHHENTLVDTSHIPARLAELGLDARVNDAFGNETLPKGLKTILATRAN
jgi:SAM-dependent methyltransferase